MAVNSAQIDALEYRIAEAAQSDFRLFRAYIRRDFIDCAFQRDMMQHMAQWYELWAAGQKPNLVINTPPQHGKSTMVIDFCAWILGKHPETRIIYASFSERLAIRANLAIQRIMSSRNYGIVFPATQIVKKGDATAQRTSTYFETTTGGYFRNTTVRGSITGESLDIGIIDDPIKGREAANSQTVRDSTWEWFTDDFFTRFSKTAGMLSIATRWHPDDPIGRLIASDSSVKCLKYPAINDKGEPLAPELKPLDFLLQRKKVLSTDSWEALYQQNPTIPGGNLIKSKYFQYYEVVPKLEHLRIFVDAAAKTKTMNDYTVFGLYAKSSDGALYVIDIMRGKWEYGPMKQNAIAMWDKAQQVGAQFGAPCLDMCIEDKSAGIQLIQELKAQYLCPITALQRNTDKFTRLQAVLGYIESGFVHLPKRAPWLKDFISECEAFTGLGDTHDDQVDTFIDALQFMCANNLDYWENFV